MCDLSYPPLDGKCRNAKNNGAVFQGLRRLVQADFCKQEYSENNRTDNPRCRKVYFYIIVYQEEQGDT